LESVTAWSTAVLSSRILGEQANMRHFFTEHYGSDRVPLLRFYEDYYREHLEGHLEREEQIWEPPSGQAAEERNRETFAQLANPFRLELVDQLNEARRGLEKRIRELWRAAPSAEEIVLERRDLEELTTRLPDLEEPLRSLFVQYLPGLLPGPVPGNPESRDSSESSDGARISACRRRSSFASCLWRASAGPTEKM
jgi:hypothetical protein